jgi:hypothetical protein
LKKEEPGKKRSVFSRAFWNQYNLILLGGAALFSLTTFSWLPLLIGAGAEVLWLVLGADSGPFRRWVAIQEGKEAREALEKRSATALATLESRYVERFHELAELAGQIEKLAKENQSLETSMIQGEMDKLGQLLHSFLDMAVLHQRFSHHLEENDFREIRRDMESCTRALEDEDDAEVKAGLKQNLELAKKRMKQHERIEATHRLLGVKMDTLEKSFRYLQTHILSISKREELSAELDGLIVGVESVEELQQEMASFQLPAETESTKDRQRRAQAARRRQKA